MRLIMQNPQIQSNKKLSPKLKFYYSSMGAGKSSQLLTQSHNYKEKGFNVVLFNYHLDNRNGIDGIKLPNEINKIYGEETTFVSSRVGLSEVAHKYNEKSNIFDLVESLDKEKSIDALFIDESQFLNKKQVRELSDICDILKIQVICYGLRTNFLGNVFEGSSELFGWADELNEIKAIDDTGGNATFVYRVNEKGVVENILNHDEIIKIDGNNKYFAVSRIEWKNKVSKY